MTNPHRTPQAANAYDDPQQVAVYSRHAEHGLVAYWERRFATTILDQFRSDQACTILDMGTGPGWIPIHLATARPDWRLVGVDLSQRMLDRAQANAQSRAVQPEWILASADATGWPDASCDAVVSHFALHEFPDPAAALREAARLLKPGGLLLWRDLQRPPAPLVPLLYGVHIVLTFSIAFSRQYAESLRAAYRPAELRPLLAALPLQGDVRPILGGSQLQIRVRQKTSA